MLTLPDALVVLGIMFTFAVTCAAVAVALAAVIITRTIVQRDAAAPPRRRLSVGKVLGDRPGFRTRGGREVDRDDVVPDKRGFPATESGEEEESEEDGEGGIVDVPGDLAHFAANLGDDQAQGQFDAWVEEKRASGYDDEEIAEMARNLPTVPVFGG